MIAAREYEVDQLWGPGRPVLAETETYSEIDGRSIYPQESPRWATSPGSSMRDYRERWGYSPAVQRGAYPYSPQEAIYGAERGVRSPQTWDTFSTLSSNRHRDYYRTHPHANYGSPQSYDHRAEAYSPHRGSPSEFSTSEYRHPPQYGSSSSRPMSPNRAVSPASSSHEMSNELVTYRGKARQKDGESTFEEGEHQSNHSGTPSPAWSSASQHTYSGGSGSGSLTGSSPGHPMYHQYRDVGSPRMPGAMPYYPPRPPPRLFAESPYTGSEYTYPGDDYLSDDVVSDYTSSDLSDLSDDSFDSEYSDDYGDSTYYSN